MQYQPVNYRVRMTDVEHTNFNYFYLSLCLVMKIFFKVFFFFFVTFIANKNLLDELQPIHFSDKIEGHFPKIVGVYLYQIFILADYICALIILGGIPTTKCLKPVWLESIRVEKQIFHFFYSSSSYFPLISI